MLLRAFKISVILSGVMLFSFPDCLGQNPSGTRVKEGVPLLMTILSRGQVSASLEYWGHCDLQSLPDLPKLRSPKNERQSPVENLREVFTENPNMQVFQQPDGIIRMVEKNVPRDILDVRIAHVSFRVDYGERDKLYDPRDAVRAVLLAPEVRAFMKANHIGPPAEFEMVPGGRRKPSEELPHISGTLGNVTVAQALDHILKTFPGLWIYENCSSRNGGRNVFFTFYENGPFWSALIDHESPSGSKE